MTVHVREKGFTLLELLLAIFLFSLVITIVYGSYRTTFRNVRTTEFEAEQAQRARIILERITSDLESAYSGKGGYLRGELGDINGRRADSVSCTSSAHLVFRRFEPEAGLTMLNYSLSEDEQTGLLRLFRSDNPLISAEDTADQDEQGELLGEGIVSFRLSYVNREGVEEDFWESESEDEEDGEAEALPVMPSLVRIELRLARFVEDPDEMVFRTAVAVPGMRAVEK